MRDVAAPRARRYIAENQDSSMFVVVVKADSSPRKCGVMQHVIGNSAASRAVGCLTFCDKLDNDEDFAMLKGIALSLPGSARPMDRQSLYAVPSLAAPDAMLTRAAKYPHHSVVRLAQQQPRRGRQRPAQTPRLRGHDEQRIAEEEPS